jgi:hypothetical protein
VKLFNKIKQRVEKLGLYGALRLTLSKSMTGWRKKVILGLEEPEDRFTKIYMSNHWNSLESRSGEGSTFENTQGIRAELPKIFEKYEIRSMLDAPCGDFNWMQSVTKNASITYIGGDIVQALIEKNQAKYGDKNISFLHLDLTKTSLPMVDLLFCRDCLFHLSYQDIARVLENFLRSPIPYFMTTSNAAPCGPRINNLDIVTGDMRSIDLFSDPFSLSQGYVLESIADKMVSLSAERSMVLVNRAAVQDLLKRLISNIGSDT